MVTFWGNYEGISQYQACLPYFRKSESWVGGADEYRGDSGPLGTCSGNDMKLNPLYEAFIEA
ncbi:hypothetical protein P3568_23460, partial [Vibrio parahaemolyticus]|nr:hypothetical protein [Vibrio parahaemolyticus]